MKIKRGDNVIVRAGKDKGRRGKVVRVIPAAEKVVIEGANVVLRRERPRREGQKGQVVQVAMPIHVSNVSLLDPKGDMQTRVGKKQAGDTKVRIAKKSGSEMK